MTTPEGSEPAPWNPGDDNVEKNAMKKLMELAEKQLKNLERHESPPGAYGMVIPPLDTFEVRAINNGFIIKFYEPIHEFNSARPVEFFAKDWDEAAPILSRGLTAVKFFFDRMRKLKA